MLAPPAQSIIAPAKVNLALRVVGKRADGYHDIESVACKVTLYDGIDVSEGQASGVEIRCSTPGVPLDRQNLIWQAIQSLANRSSGQTPSLSIRLHKRIPVGGGLGGASSDAAQMMLFLNRRWCVGLELPELTMLAAEVGCDVPLFLQPRDAYIRGRGEIVEPVQLPWKGWLLLVFPPFAMSTAEVYHAWRPRNRAGTHNVRACLRSNCNRAEELDEVLFNDLENSILGIRPQMGALKTELERRTHRRFHITGSGSTMFVCADTHEEAKQLDECLDHTLDIKKQIVRLIDTERQQVRNDDANLRNTCQAGGEFQGTPQGVLQHHTGK